MNTHERYRIGIDTGGTFTDVVAVEERTGRIFTTKVPSTPHDPSAGLMAGVGRIMDVVLGPLEDSKVDARATAALRAKLRARRPRRLFDRGPYYEAMVKPQLAARRARRSASPGRG